MTFNSKLLAIKALREMSFEKTGEDYIPKTIGLKDAKDFVEGVMEMVQNSNDTRMSTIGKIDTAITTACNVLYDGNTLHHWQRSHA